MKKSVILATSSAMFAMITGVCAQAGGLNDPIATLAPAPVFTPAPVSTGGDWTGFYAGGQLGFGDVETPAFSEDQDGAVYGVHAGYNYDLGSVILGAELDYDASNITDSGTGIDVDSVARLKARIGYDAGALMPYLTAGVAQLNTGGGLEADDTGAFAGLGVAYKVVSNLTVGGEVLKHEFEDFAGSGADIDATTATLRVSYSF